MVFTTVEVPARISNLVKYLICGGFQRGSHQFEEVSFSSINILKILLNHSLPWF
jgi:hypothetical protein